MYRGPLEASWERFILDSHVRIRESKYFRYLDYLDVEILKHNQEIISSRVTQPVMVWIWDSSSPVFFVGKNVGDPRTQQDASNGL
jgi:hypothetical protein